MVICLERDADLHIAQLMPLPLTVSCSSKIQIGFTFLVPAHPGRPPGQRAVKRVCVCLYRVLRHLSFFSSSLFSYLSPPLGWWRGSVVERRSLAGELSLSCACPAADG